MLNQVFPDDEALQGAKHYIQEVVDLIGYDKVEHILAITCRTDQAISVNLGQWLILRFRRKGDGMEAQFALDCEPDTTFEGLTFKKMEAFSKRWAGERSIYLVTFDWDGRTQLPADFLNAWKSAIRYAYQIFKGWTASSYMNYHQPELTSALVSETARSRHADYLQGEVGELFEALRKRILNLDPSVREEFKKLYIAYKTSTNFVDVVPQRSGLRLSLNMKFSEVHDPKGICRDITDIGRWGNGDVEIRLTAAKQLEDVMFLIRQAFEKHSDLEIAA